MQKKKKFLVYIKKMNNGKENKSSGNTNCEETIRNCLMKKRIYGRVWKKKEYGNQY